MVKNSQKLGTTTSKIREKLKDDFVCSKCYLNAIKRSNFCLNQKSPIYCELLKLGQTNMGDMNWGLLVNLKRTLAKKALIMRPNVKSVHFVIITLPRPIKNIQTAIIRSPLIQKPQPQQPLRKTLKFAKITYIFVPSLIRSEECFCV